MAFARVFAATAGLLVVVAACGCTKPSPSGPIAATPGRADRPATDSAPPPAAPATPPAAAVTPPAADPPPAPPGRIRDISFDDIKLPLEKGEPFTPEIVPAAVQALERQRVRIRGYILPSFQQRGITDFVLVRDNMECCFGPGALLHDCVVVRMLPGRSTEFSIRPVAVSGTFRIDERKGPDGKHLAVYAMDGEEVR